VAPTKKRQYLDKYCTLDHPQFFIIETAWLLSISNHGKIKTEFAARQG